MALPTLREVWRLALPRGTQLVTGQDDLDRPVLWARRMGTRPPLFSALEAGELALFDLAEAQRLDEGLALEQIVAALVELGAVGAGMVGEHSAWAIAEAGAAGMAVFLLPPGADLRETEHAVIRLIVEREAQLDRRGRQIYRHLAQLSLAQKGLGAITEALSELTGAGIFLQDSHGQMVSQAWPRGREPSVPLREALSSEPGLLAWLSGQRLDDSAPPITECPLGGTGLVCCVAGVVVQGELSGTLSLVAHQGELDDLDRLAVERGALACAVELAKQRAVALAEDRLRGEFLEALLTSLRPDRAWLERQARELGYSLEDPQQVLCFGPADPSHSLRVASLFRMAAHQAGLTALTGLRPQEVIVLCSGESPPRRLIDLAEQVCRQMEGVLAGVGGAGPGMEGARASYRQAQEALSLARRVPAWGPALAFGDLGVLQLLCELRGGVPLESFCQAQLGDLLAYDQAHDTDLVTTLRAFFVHHGNVARAAEALHLHRNSLIYRLKRIAEITGLDLEEPEDRFALQLALKLLPLCEGAAFVHSAQ